MPAGFTYALVDLVHRGHATLAAGARATVRTFAYFSGESVAEPLTSVITGPFDDDVSITGAAVPQLAPCGGPRHLNVVLDVRIAPGTGDSTGITSQVAITRSVVQPPLLHPCPAP